MGSAAAQCFQVMPRHRRRRVAFYTLPFPLCSLLLGVLWYMPRTGKKSGIRVCSGGEIWVLCWNTSHLKPCHVSSAAGRTCRREHPLLCRRTKQTHLTCPSLCRAKPIGKGTLKASLMSKQLFSLCPYRRDAERQIKGEGEHAACHELLLVLAGAVLAPSAREGDIASLGVSGPQAGLAAVASVWLPPCSLCFPEAEIDDIIKSLVLSRAKSSAQPQVALSSHCILISGVSQKQSSSPSHSSRHSPSKDPSLLGVPGVLLVSLPTCCAGNRLGPVSPHCDQALGTKPSWSLLLPTRFRVTARTEHATAWNGMNPTSLLPLWCPREQNNPFGLCSNLPTLQAPLPSLMTLLVELSPDFPPHHHSTLFVSTHFSIGFDTE